MSTVLPSVPPARPRPGLAMLAVLAAAAASAALLLWALADPVFAAAFFAGALAIGLPLLLLGRGGGAAAPDAPETGIDLALVRAGLDASPDALAVTGADGALLAANHVYEAWFGLRPPPELPLGDSLAGLAAAAARDGRAGASGLAAGDIGLDVEVRSAGQAEGALLWRFVRADEADAAAEARRLLGGEIGRRLGGTGLMAVLTAADGRILEANGAFHTRAGGEAEVAPGTPLVDLLAIGEQNQFHFVREGKAGGALRILQVPLAEEEGAPSLFLLLDEVGAVGADGAHNINALLEILPLGLALADRDGRFVYLNAAFRRAAGLSRSAAPTWPSDLVVDEDKAAVADSVRRFGRGATMSGDVAVRLKANAEEPVALTVAGARGLGEAAVLLSLKDNSEEDRLKRQVAQATKMQAVGQLAGGVAHDFNNILTAIIGHCDLMLMRHAPGDSDYDDIQQIRSNSNRAASLTRQLLAFSRQQTLRPQVLQLPDVIAEVSTLLKRLLGERVKLQVKHGRGLGAVRADPGQLEQVIVNLAVNARDAMLVKDDQSVGLLTLHTYAVSADDVRRMGSEILPIADYTALRVSDTGTGIAPHLLPKIFEPFFTTKEVGKGTGPRPLHRLRHRQAVGRLHLRGERAGQGHQLRHLPARPPRRGGQAGAQGPRAGRRIVGHGHDPAGRGRGDRARRRGTGADPARLHGAARREWRGGDRDTRPREKGRPDDLRRRHADHGRPDHRPRGAAPPARPADPVHLRLCRGAASPVDRPRPRRLPRQALLRPEARRGDARRAGDEIARRPSAGWGPGGRKAPVLFTPAVPAFAGTTRIKKLVSQMIVTP